MGKLTGKVAVITGANQGIGKGILRGPLRRKAAGLGHCARNQEKLDATAAELRGRG